MSDGLVLALDTCFGPVQAALATLDGKLIGWDRDADAVGRQAETLPPLVADLFRKADAAFSQIRRVVVVTGPGAFTGVRVGIAFAKGLRIAVGAEVLGITSLECIADQVLRAQAGQGVAVALDAKRSECYLHGVDDRGRCVIAPRLVSTSDAGNVLRQAFGARDFLLVGSARDLIDPEIGLRLQQGFDCVDIQLLTRRGGALSASDHLPIPAYLRDPDARLPS